MTKKLYNQDAYLKSAEARVIAINDDSLVLDQTIFSPDSGGQPWDLGNIQGVPLTGVTESNGELKHLMSKDNLEHFRVGDIVNLELDWDRRFDHMQNHIGEHILSGIFKSEYGLDNKGFHLGDDVGTFDIDAKVLSDEIIDRVEELANQVVYSALPIEIHILKSAEEAKRLPLRKALKVDENIRVVSIPNVDCVACCCPHPSDTSQVGIIKIIRTEKYKGMTRVYFKCGKRAYMDYRKKHKVISSLNEKYSADEFSLLEKVEIYEKKNNNLRREFNIMKDRMAEIKANEILSNSENIIMQEFENADMEELRNITKKLEKLTEKPIILSSIKNLCVILTVANNKSISMGKIVKEHALGSGGKGGGRDDQAQVFFQDLELMRNFIKIANIDILNRL